MTTGLQSVPDGELARESQAGSFPAFEELVCRYEGRIYRFVLNLCRNEADAREVTQDTFVRAFQAIGQFDARHSFAAWLFTIARRKCIDRHRAAPPPAGEPLPDLVSHDDPAQILSVREERHNLWRVARQCLPELQFQAVWLRYAEEMSVTEIARVLRRTGTHVKVLLFRARLALGRELIAAQAVGPRATVPHASRLTKVSRQGAASVDHASRFTPHASSL